MQVHGKTATEAADVVAGATDVLEVESDTGVFMPIASTSHQ
jgi:hypothetical protein